jgi:hypothetical protein
MCRLDAGRGDVKIDCFMSWNEQEGMMRKYLVLAAMAGAIFAAAAALPDRASAMAIGMPAGLSKAVADTNQAEPVQWCGWRGCWGGGPYWGQRPYWGGYYRPYGFYGYGYRPWGWGWRRW